MVEINGLRVSLVELLFLIFELHFLLLSRSNFGGGAR
jgi:hypothetical protein